MSAKLSVENIVAASRLFNLAMPKAMFAERGEYVYITAEEFAELEDISLENAKSYLQEIANVLFECGIVAENKNELTQIRFVESVELDEKNGRVGIVINWQLLK